MTCSDDSYWLCVSVFVCVYVCVCVCVCLNVTYNPKNEAA